MASEACLGVLMGSGVCSELTEGLKKKKQIETWREEARQRQKDRQTERRSEECMCVCQRKTDTDRKRKKKKKEHERGQDPAGGAYC